MLREKKEPIIEDFFDKFKVDIDTISTTISDNLVKDSKLSKDTIHAFLLDFFNRGARFKGMFYVCMLCGDSDVDECPLCDHIFLDKDM